MESNERGLKFVPVLVEPLYQGNIGSVARLARNFGMDKMILVSPPDLQDEAYAYSMHGKCILEEAQVLSSFGEACEHVDVMVGSSGVSDSAEKAYLRNPMDPGEFIGWTKNVSGTVGIAFGREDKGLFREELELCDILVTIPADPEYPVLNLSHAAAVLFYTIWTSFERTPRRNARTMTGIEKRTLLEHYDRLMDVSRVPEHKKVIARTNFRRMVARAAPSYREYNSLMGTFSRAMDYKRKKINGVERA
ncbi:MAG: RNA methyltransferase [Thermoplasmatota archaeon]